MKVFRSIYLIINYKTFIITALAVASTWLCDYYQLVANFPLTLVGIAIVFPVVFSIDSAYNRRERALALLADFKAHFLVLYHASRDWLDREDEEFSEKIKGKLIGIFDTLKLVFTSRNSSVSQKTIYDTISDLSKSLQEFRALGLQIGEMSRVDQYLSKMMVDIENLAGILNYRTPITLRAYSKVFIYSFPILYGPYFVHAATDYSAGLEYMMPVVFSFILVSLDNIQSHLENPFDQIGEDDIQFNVEEFEKLIKD